MFSPVAAVDPQRVDEAVLDVLTGLLGPHTSRRALEVARLRAGEEFSDELERVCAGLSPMLRTLLGRKATTRALDRIRRRVEAHT